MNIKLPTTGTLFFLKKVLIVFVAVVFTAASLPYVSPTQAKACDEDFYSSNDIMFYDPCAVANSCSTNTGTSLVGVNNREKIYNFLVQKGLNKEQAAGVLGNIKNESGYSPTRHEDSKANFEDGGYGIAQWTYGRRTTLVSYLQQNAASIMGVYYNTGYGGSVKEADGFIPRSSSSGELIPVADNDILLSAELNFLYNETSSRRITATTSSHTSAKQGDNEWAALKNATGVEDATKIWLYNFEVPANIEQAAINRAASANDMLSSLPSSGTGGASCLDTTSGSVAAFQATVKLYAWPEYHPSGYVTTKPEYAQAVSKASAAGGYVGGIQYRGVDCGGFVTRTMIDSGYEPNYNSAKGATAAQKAWLDSNWEKLGTGNSIDTATLKPGDVAMKPGHTFMFAGTNIDGFGTTTSGWKGVASASLDERAPMAGLEDITDSSVSWYRKRVTSNG